MRQIAVTVTDNSVRGGLWRGRWWLALLLIIAAVALGLRLQGLDWDGGNFYHPDERSIYLRADCMYQTLTESPNWLSCQNRDFPLDTPGIPGIGTLLDKDASSLNPHWFPLGTIIIYLLVGVRFLLEPFMDQVRLEDLASVGRTLAALADTASVVFMFFLGRRLFGPAVGLLASALTAVSVINIQVTHFYRPESFVIFLALVAFWWMLNVLERGRLRDHAMLGLVIGITFAFRGSSLPILAPVGLTYLVVLWRHMNQGADVRESIRVLAPSAALAAGLALLAFAVIQPYALLDFRTYVTDLARETNIARVAGLVPYTLQYVGTTKTGLYELQQTTLWGLGVPLGIVAWGGLAATIVYALRRPRMEEWLLLAWVLALIVAVVPLFEVKYLRYIMPVLPVMVLLGSRWLVEAYRYGRTKGPAFRNLAGALTAVVVVATAFYALAFTSIYRTDHPGVQASNWMNENAAIGDVILTDNHWDEGFGNLFLFNVDQIPIYEGDTIVKVVDLVKMLVDADYIMAYSNRPWGSVARLPERFPYSSTYYQALFAEELGYELVQGFARYPTFAGVSFVHDPFTRSTIPPPASVPGLKEAPLALNLGYADENIVNYDHPLVLVWRNTGRLSEDALFNILLAGDHTPAERAMLSEEAAAQQQASGTWTDIFDESGPNRWFPWLVWLVAVEVIFLAALPLSARLMRWLPDRGVVLARPLGLLLVSWLVWLGASSGFWTFSRQSVAISVLILAAVSGVLLCRNRSLIGMAKQHWRYIVSVEALFIAAYLAFVLIRAANPDLWHAWRGGEKPMDLSYLTAVVKSATFPPYDPWYAGGFINYYYYGFVIVASLIRFTGIVPEVAYNLAVPLLFALTLTGAFSVGYNLSAALRQHDRLSVSMRWSPVAGGIAAALLVVVLANVDGAVQLLQGAARSFNGESFGQFDFWRSSRLMPGQINITEFPFWTFLFADLHAHLIALPFQVLAVGLAANLVIGARSVSSLRRFLPEVAILGMVVGSLAAINTWDVPTYALLAVAALAIVVLTRAGRELTPMALAKWLLLVAFFWAVLYGAWLPYHQHYDAPATGVKISQWQTVFWHYLGIHALLITAVVSWLAVEIWRRVLGGTSVLRPKVLLLIALLFLLVFATVLGFDALRPWTTVAVLALLLIGALAVALSWVVRRAEPEAPIHLLLIAALVLALGIGIGVDFITVENDIDRMNTVFKLYLNAWVLLGIVGGVGLWHLASTGAMRVRGLGRIGLARAPWLVLLALLVLASAIYPVLGTRARIADRFDTSAGVTLDGRAYQDVAIYSDQGATDSPTDDAFYPLSSDADALDYIRANVEGSPVFLEAATPHAYRWYPRVAEYTGLPVVVGWQWHQTQQRGAGGAEPGAVFARIDDVATMYLTTDEERFLELADEYDVEYIYVGSSERVYFSGEGLEKFDRMVGESLEVFFSNGETTVYRRLPGPGEAASAHLVDYADFPGLGWLTSRGEGRAVIDQETVQLVRDILIGVYLAVGIFVVLTLLLFAFLLFKALRRLLNSATRTIDNIGKATETATDYLTKPFGDGGGSGNVGNAIGLAAGFLSGFRSRSERR